MQVKKKRKKSKSINKQETPQWAYTATAMVVTLILLVVIFFWGGTLWRFTRGLIYSGGEKSEIPDYLNDSIYNERPDGVDMSHYQRDIEWKVLGVHPTVKFVYLKATEGEELYDKYYNRHHAQARNAGLQVGSYHFYRPKVPVMAQVNNFLEHTDFTIDHLKPVIDIEVQGGLKKKALQDSLRLCLDTITAIIGDKPILYTSRNFYHEVLEERFGNYPLWIADYRHGESLPANCVLWQYTDKGKVLGIRHEVDCNRLTGSLSKIQL